MVLSLSGRVALYNNFYSRFGGGGVCDQYQFW